MAFQQNQGNSQTSRETDAFLKDVDPKNLFEFNNGYGRTMVARIVFPDEPYGREGCLTWGEPQKAVVNPEVRQKMWEKSRHQPGIEFYDASCKGKPGFSTLGQFVSRYYLETLLGKDGFTNDPEEHTSGRVGLDLYGGEPCWTISGPVIKNVLEWAQKVVGERQGETPAAEPTGLRGQAAEKGSVTPPQGWSPAENAHSFNKYGLNSFRSVLEKTLGGNGTPKYDLTVLFDGESQSFIPAHGDVVMPNRVATANEAAAIAMDWYKKETSMPWDILKAAGQPLWGLQDEGWSWSTNIEIPGSIFQWKGKEERTVDEAQKARVFAVAALREAGFCAVDMNWNLPVHEQAIIAFRPEELEMLPPSRVEKFLVGWNVHEEARWDANGDPTVFGLTGSEAATMDPTLTGRPRLMEFNLHGQAYHFEWSETTFKEKAESFQHLVDGNGGGWVLK